MFGYLKAAAAAVGLLAITCAAPATAERFDYRLTGTGAGYIMVGDDPFHVTFSGLDMAFDWIGSTPGIDIGLAVLNPVSSGTLCSAVCVGTPLTIDFAFPTFMGFGEGLSNGIAGIVTAEAGTTVSHAAWTGAGLVDYLGDTPLSPIPVILLFMDAFQGHNYGTDTTVVVESLTDARFSATALPEPAEWALLIAGFGVCGGALRRQRAAIAA